MSEGDEASPDALEVRFQWNVRAVESARSFVVALSRPHGAILWRSLMVAGVGGGSLMLAKFLSPDTSWLGLAHVALTALVVAGGALWVLSQAEGLQRARRAEKDYRRIDWSSVTIGREGVFLRTETRDEFISWFGVKRVHDVDGLIYFEHDKQMGIAVPDVAFGDRRERAFFLDTARRFYAGRTPQQPLREEGESWVEDMPPPAKLH